MSGVDRPVRKNGAVLVIFLDQPPQGPSLLFTKRAASLEEHAGQISFPGGAVEPADPNLIAAALRETFEEVGIEAGELELLSPLPRQPVLDQWLIHPFSAWWSAPRRLQPDPAEVERVIISPLSELGRQHQPDCWRLPDPEQCPEWGHVPPKGVMDETVRPGTGLYPHQPSCRYHISGELLWGATARITGRLLDSLLKP